MRLGVGSVDYRIEFYDWRTSFWYIYCMVLITNELGLVFGKLKNLWVCLGFDCRIGLLLYWKCSWSLGVLGIWLQASSMALFGSGGSSRAGADSVRRTESADQARRTRAARLPRAWSSSSSAYHARRIPSAPSMRLGRLGKVLHGMRAPTCAHGSRMQRAWADPELILITVIVEIYVSIVWL